MSTSTETGEGSSSRDVCDSYEQAGKGRSGGGGEVEELNIQVAEVPSLVKDIAHNGQYEQLEELISSGLMKSPRAVATIAAAGHDDVISRLIVHEPEYGLAVVYGSLCCGDQNQLFYARLGMDAALEVDYLQGPVRSAPILSEDFSRLAVYAVQCALRARKPISGSDAKIEREYSKLVRQCESFPSAVKAAAEKGPVDASIERIFPHFAKCKSNIDQIRHAMVSGCMPYERLVCDTERTTENYLTAAYMCTTPKNGALRGRGLQYLGALDPQLHNFFIDSVLTGYTGQSIIP
jgi:hypothetical protein